MGLYLAVECGCTRVPTACAGKGSVVVLGWAVRCVIADSRDAAGGSAWRTPHAGSLGVELCRGLSHGEDGVGGCRPGSGTGQCWMTISIQCRWRMRSCGTLGSAATRPSRPRGRTPGALVLFLRWWCQATDRDWRTAAAELGLFILWLRRTAVAAEAAVVRPGPGVAPVRREARINRVLIAVRGFARFAVATGQVPRAVLGQIDDVADTRDLPIEATGEGTGLAYRLAAQHSVTEPRRPVTRGQR